MSKERWRPVVGYETRYEVSDLGKVRVTGRDALGRARYLGHILKPNHSGKYLFVSLSRGDNSGPKSFLVHAIVAAAFIGPRPKGQTTNHKDGNKHNNCWKNLEYCTYSENYRHALDVLGFQPPRGEAHWNAKLTEADVVKMRRQRFEGMTVKEIAAERGFPMGWVSLITRGKVWAHVVPHTYLEFGEERPK